jgi:hypothetical protein
MPTTLTNLMTKEQIAQHTPAISTRMLSHWLQVNLDDFRTDCAVKIGRRILLDQEAVEAWLGRHKIESRSSA